MMKTLGIIGLGNMGGAIARGLAPAGMFHMFGYDPDEDTRNRQSDIMHILISPSISAQFGASRHKLKSG